MLEDGSVAIARNVGSLQLTVDEDYPAWLELTTFQRCKCKYTNGATKLRSLPKIYLPRLNEDHSNPWYLSVASFMIDHQSIQSQDLSVQEKDKACHSPVFTVSYHRDLICVSYHHFYSTMNLSPLFILHLRKICKYRTTFG